MTNPEKPRIAGHQHVDQRTFLESVNERLEKVEGHFEDEDGRVRKLESEFSERDGRVSKLEHWQTEMVGIRADRILMVGVLLMALQIIGMVLGWIKP